jgi:hypothetical protein
VLPSASTVLVLIFMDENCREIFALGALVVYGAE